MLAKLTGERENTNYQHMNIRSERGDITTNPADTQRYAVMKNIMPQNSITWMKQRNSLKNMTYEN